MPSSTFTAVFLHVLIIQLVEPVQPQNEQFQLYPEYDRIRCSQQLTLVYENKQEHFWINLYFSTQNFSCSLSSAELLRDSNNWRVKSIHTLNEDNVSNRNCSELCTQVFPNMTDGFYCAHKIRNGVYSKNLNTKTVQLKINCSTTSSPLTKPSNLWIAATTAIGVVIVIIIIIMYVNRKYKHVNEDAESTQVPTKTSCKPLLFIQTRQIFVVYHRDDDNHFKMVEMLVQLLETFKWDVVVDYKYKQEISVCGVTTWVSNAIQSCSKIIFVSSENSHRLIKSIAHNNTAQRTFTSSSTTEGIFMFAWRKISSNIGLCFNYNKIYNVRFRSTMSCYITPDIVPARHFVIPTHLPELFEQLSNNNSSIDFKVDIKASPIYSKLVKAVLPIQDPSRESEDEKWISHGS